MSVLIELFDADEPLFNLLPALVLRPERLIVLGDKRAQREKYKKPLLRTLAMCGLDMPVIYHICDLYDLAEIMRTLTHIAYEYGWTNCVLDVTGGSDALLFAAGGFCRQYNTGALLNRPGENRLVWLGGPKNGEDIPYDICITPQQAITMAGGETLRQGRIDAESIDAAMSDTVARVFPIFRQFSDRWPFFVQYLQMVCKPEHWKADAYRAPKQLVCNHRPLMLDRNIMHALARAGIVESFQENASHCAFRFRSEETGRLLCDVGIWLELYLFVVIRRSALFDAQEISLIISWDDDEEDENRNDVTNEIDVMATAGVGQFFFSCKTRLPTTADLNEIATLTRRFGTRYATAVLVTSSELGPEAEAMCRRAEEMGVEIIGGAELNEELLQNRLRALKRKWDRE